MLSVSTPYTPLVRVTTAEQAHGYIIGAGHGWYRRYPAIPSSTMKIALGLAGVTISGVWAAFDTVVPTDDALPTGNPPGFFDRRENIISPLGVSGSLNTEPALLHTNKFYSNFLVRIRSSTLSVEPLL